MRIEALPFQHPDAVLLIDQVQSEYVRRYGGKDSPAAEPADGRIEATDGPPAPARFHARGERRLEDVREAATGAGEVRIVGDVASPDAAIAATAGRRPSAQSRG